MTVIRLITVFSCAALIVSCATPERTARISSSAVYSRNVAGLTPPDTVEIAATLRKLTSAPIFGYSRGQDGIFYVSTDGDGIYSARKIRGKWILARQVGT